MCLCSAVCLPLCPHPEHGSPVQLDSNGCRLECSILHSLLVATEEPLNFKGSPVLLSYHSSHLVPSDMRLQNDCSMLCCQELLPSPPHGSSGSVPCLHRPGTVAQCPVVHPLPVASAVGLDELCSRDNSFLTLNPLMAA